MIRRAAIEGASAPLRRTTPMPPRPGGVATATIVSRVENGMASAASRYLRKEMSTVFEKASPTLSVVTPGTSATAM